MQCTKAREDTGANVTIPAKVCHGIFIQALFSFTVLVEAQVSLHVVLGSILLEVKGVFTEPLTLLYYVSYMPALASKFSPQPSTDVGQDMGGVKRQCSNALQSDTDLTKGWKIFFQQ